MSKKIKRVIAGVVGIGMIIVLLLFVNSLTGNPISKAIAKKSAIKYVEANYADLDVNYVRCGYSFKNGRYIVFFQSPTSEDTAFSVETASNGKVKYDNYESSVVNKFNTFTRLSDELYKVTKTILEYNLKYDFEYAGIRFAKETDETKFELDMELDISEPPDKLVADIVVFDAECSYERIAEIAKDVEQKMTEQRIPISYVSVRIIPLENKNKTNSTWVGSISINDFPTSLLGEPDLAKFMEQYEIEKNIELDKEKNP